MVLTVASSKRLRHFELEQLIENYDAYREYLDRFTKEPPYPEVDYDHEVVYDDAVQKNRDKLRSVLDQNY